MPFRVYLTLAYLTMFCSASGVSAAPYIPTVDTQVLERLPFKPSDPVARDIVQMRAELLRNPHNVDVAVRLARRYYELVAGEGDPRYLGYAQAALTLWWDMPVPPIEVQVMRASLAQFRHDFIGALADLTQVIERNPRHSQARSLRAIIHIVQARYPQARADCQALRGVTSDLIAIGCKAMVDATGKAAPAYSTLRDAFSQHPEATSDENLWVLIRLAEMAQRLGWAKITEAHFRQALALNITDTLLFAAYADFLLDQKRPAEALTLLKNKISSDTLLLRLVFAERALNLPDAKKHEATLAARYAAAQLRGDTVHQQEEARFALHIQQDPKKALILAQENWKMQREPRDARIFLEAAVAVKDLTTARPVLQWLEESHIEDQILISLAQQLKGAHK